MDGMEVAMTEQWLPAVGFYGYEVSNLGRVRSVDRILPCGNNRQRVHRGRVLRPGTAPKGGHQFVGLGGGRLRYVHRLVAAAFIGPCPDGMEVRHLNGDPTDNRVENLAYGTHQQNAIDSVRHGTNYSARKTECINGHPFSGDNLAPRKDGRRCRICKNESNRRRKQRIRNEREAAQC